MTPEPDVVRIVVADASVLINFIHVDLLSLLGRLDGFEFLVPEQVIEEISRPGQAAKLAAALEAGHLIRVVSTDPGEIQSYAELHDVMGRGEAACLAIAEARGWWVACDERGRFLRHLRDRLGPGRVVNTPGLFILAIRAGLLTFKEADRLKVVLEEHRFKMRFTSFREVAGNEPR